MNWINRQAPPPMQRRTAAVQGRLRDPNWLRCPGCQAAVHAKDWADNLQVCPTCAHHGSIAARQRLASLLEAGQCTELGLGLSPHDVLQFRDSAAYADRLDRARGASSEVDALVAQTGCLRGLRVAVACFEFRFMGGSMGSVVGERFARTVDAACEQRLPLICITASGGARMQEGLYSLMQMSKTSAAVANLRRARLPYIAILTHPTMGGVSASFAFLADIVMAEPGALIGFAGPRVIEQTIGATLPAGFQRAEFQQRRGAVDMIVDRREQPALLHRLLCMLLHDR